MKLFLILLAVLMLTGCQCVRSHSEIQWEAPPSMVVGGGKYGGGIALPMGNMRQVQVEVCDEYE